MSSAATSLKSIRKPSALAREEAKAKSQEACYASLRRGAALRANRLLEHFHHAGVAFDIEPPRDGDLMVVRIGIRAPTVRVPFEIDTTTLKCLNDDTVAALASFLPNAACALGLVPPVTDAPNFRAITPVLRNVTYEKPKPDLAGLAVVYDGSRDTAAFFPIHHWATATAAALADAIADSVPRAPDGFATPTKRHRTTKEERQWVAAMSMAPHRPHRQLTYP